MLLKDHENHLKKWPAEWTWLPKSKEGLKQQGCRHQDHLKNSPVNKDRNPFEKGLKNNPAIPYSSLSCSLTALNKDRDPLKQPCQKGLTLKKEFP